MGTKKDVFKRILEDIKETINQGTYDDTLHGIEAIMNDVDDLVSDYGDDEGVYIEDLSKEERKKFISYAFTCLKDRFIKIELQGL